MDNAQTTAIAHGSEPSFDKKAIWRTFRVLLVITIVELILAIGYYEMEFQNRHLVKILTRWQAMSFQHGFREHKSRAERRCSRSALQQGWSWISRRRAALPAMAAQL